MSQVVAALYHAIDKHAGTRATPRLVTSMQLLVAREQEFLDMIQLDLEMVARERAEQEFGVYQVQRPEP